jgi:DNA-binding XRE family transcriptional regulator
MEHASVAHSLVTLLSRQMKAGKPEKRTGQGGGRPADPKPVVQAAASAPKRARVARRPRKASPEPVLIGGEDPLEVLGRRVNSLRVGQDLSQEELADRASLDRTYVSGIERGSRNPTLLVLLRLGRALGTSLDELITPS